MNERVDIAELTIGMFVAELDRPWIDTPFQLQGFIIETEEQIRTLKQLCKFVYVDGKRSIGVAHRIHSDIDSAVPRKPVQVRVRDSVISSGGLVGQSSFLASLKAIWKAAVMKDGAVKQSQRTTKPDTTLSAISLEYVHLENGLHRGITQSEVEHLLGTAPPITTYSFFHRFRDWIFALISRKRPNDASDAAEYPPSDSQQETPIYPDQAVFEDELPRAIDAHRKSEEAIHNIIDDIRNSKPISIETAEDAVAWMTESIIRNPDSLSWLVQLKSHNHYTYDHSLKVCVYLLNFGRHFGLPKVMLQLLGTAGLLQDIGKIKVPLEILEKQASLTISECEVLKGHVQHSIDILQNSRHVSPTLLQIVMQHHERFDGGGYPNGLKGPEISMLGAMAGIVDAFVGMTSDRPYGNSLSPMEALQSLYASRGEAFGVELVQEFIKCVGIFPVGSFVELNTGEAAIVVSHNRTYRRYPRIMLILDPSKQPYSVPVVLDLMMRPLSPSGEPYGIKRSLHTELKEIDVSKLPPAYSVE